MGKSSGYVFLAQLWRVRFSYFPNQSLQFQTIYLFNSKYEKLFILFYGLEKLVGLYVFVTINLL